MKKVGWVYIMADLYRGAMYVGVTANIKARVAQHQTGAGSEFCQRYGLIRLVWTEQGHAIDACIAHEKRLKRWRREWKFALIEIDNPDWRDLSKVLTSGLYSGTPGRARSDDQSGGDSPSTLDQD